MVHQYGKLADINTIKKICDEFANDIKKNRGGDDDILRYAMHVIVTYTCLMGVMVVGRLPRVLGLEIRRETR